MAGAFTLGIPSWEQSQLVNLQSANLLSGLTGEDVGIIAQAESSGNFDPNPGGPYGGYFGLGKDKTYPAGESTTALLETDASASNPTAFDEQAEIAASAFAKYLTEFGGNVTEAENFYQTGQNPPSTSPGEGAKLFQQAGITSITSQGQSPTVVAPADSSSSAPTTQSPQIHLAGVGGVLQELNDLLNPSGGSFFTQLTSLGTSDIKAFVELIVFRVMFGVGFGLVAYVGFKTLTSPGSSSSVIQVINQTSNAQTRRQNANTAQAREQRLSQPVPASSVNGPLKEAGATVGGESIGADLGEALLV
jgi:hypothetical protein